MSPIQTNDSLEDAIKYSKKFIEDVLSFFGLNINVHATSLENNVIELDIPSTHMNGFLIGQHGDTARSLQYLVSNSLRSQGYSNFKVNLDIADYKKNHTTQVLEQAAIWFKEVKESKLSKSLNPMNAADRRTIHKAAEEYGLETVSEGEGRDRHIVIRYILQ